MNKLKKTAVSSQSPVNTKMPTSTTTTMTDEIVKKETKNTSVEDMTSINLKNTTDTDDNMSFNASKNKAPQARIRNTRILSSVSLTSLPEPPPYKVVPVGSTSLVGPHRRVYQPIYVTGIDGEFDENSTITYRYSVSISYSLNSTAPTLYPDEYVLTHSQIPEQSVQIQTAPTRSSLELHPNRFIVSKRKNPITENPEEQSQHDRIEPFSPIIVNIKRSSLHALYRTIYQTYLRQYNQERDSQINRYDWQIGWVDRCNVQFFRKLAYFQKVNHLPGIELLSKKRNIVKLINHVSEAAKDVFTFFPMSWNLPKEREKFEIHLKERQKYEDDNNVPENQRRAYIVKPGSACQGRGIYLIQKIEDLKSSHNHVVSEYIPRPYLIQGRKFDLRIYVVVTSANPLRIYAFQEGLARFCTEPYECPNAENLSKVYGHLTNYSLNKKNSNFKSGTTQNTSGVAGDNDEGGDNGGDDDGDGEGSSSHPESLKWTITQLNAYLTQEHGIERVRSIWANINDIMVRTILTASPVMDTVYKMIFNNEATKGRTFQLIGFDIMLDETLTPWLIEVNRNPSLFCDSPLDHDIKTSMLGQLLRIVDPCNSIRPIDAPNGSLPCEKRPTPEYCSDEIDDSNILESDAKMMQGLINNVTTEKNAQQIFTSSQSEGYKKWKKERDELELQYRLEHEDYTINLLQSVTSHVAAFKSLFDDHDMKQDDDATPPPFAPITPEREAKSPLVKELSVPFTDIPYSESTPVYTHNWHRLYPVLPFYDYPTPHGIISRRGLELNSPTHLITTGTKIEVLKSVDTVNNLLQQHLPVSYPVNDQAEKERLQTFYDKFNAIVTQRSTTLDPTLIREAYSQPRPGLLAQKAALGKVQGAGKPTQWLVRPNVETE